MQAGLRYFIEVARHGSIRAASERLNVAASAISRQIKIFEDGFGSPLIQRSVKGVELTAAGDAFLVYAKAVEAERVRVRQSIDELNGLKRGHVRIACIDGIVSGPVSNIICGFRKRYPGITFDLRTMGTEAIVDQVRNADADIGIALQPTTTEGVRVVHRVIDPMCVVFSTAHEFASAESVTFAEALRFPMALPDTSFGIRRIIDAACRKQKLKPNMVLETNSIEAMRGFARSGSGITMMPYFTSRRDVETGTVRAIPLDDDDLREPTIDIFVHLEREPPVSASKFLSILCDEIGSKSTDGRH